jgi:hypothetical protein
MATRSISRMYDACGAARAVLADLAAAGIPDRDISVVARQAEEESMAGAGAGIGALVGGGAGLLAGIGTLAIPGVGPVVAAGWLVATLAGAVVGGGAGGLLGSLIHEGVSEEEANVYAEGVRRGGTLVSVRVPESREAEVEQIMVRHNYVDWQARRREYVDTGWSRFDDSGYVPPGAPPSDRR